MVFGPTDVLQREQLGIIRIHSTSILTVMQHVPAPKYIRRWLQDRENYESLIQNNLSAYGIPTAIKAIPP